MLVKMKIFFLPSLISALLIVLFGFMLKVPAIIIVELIICSFLLELMTYCFSYRKENARKTIWQTFETFKKFIQKTFAFPVCMLLFLMYKNWEGTDQTTLLFYKHIIVLFYAIGYILSLNTNMSSKENESE